jgi:GNAT superfamily N-acetyltransferase
VNLAPREVFDLYVGHVRARPIEGFRLEVLPHLSRYTATTPGGEGFVGYARLPPGRADELIAEQIAHFARAGQGFEWKVFAFDEPADLRRRLEARGFAAGPVEGFSVRPLAGVPDPVRLPAGHAIRRLTDEAGIRDFVRVQEAVWGRAFPGYLESLLATLQDAPGATEFYGAYSGDQPVGCGKLDCLVGSPFAELHAGAVLAGFRGRGLYSALYHARLHRALAQGYAYLAVDAAPMSRPILAAKGFIPVCDTWPMQAPAPP